MITDVSCACYDPSVIENRIQRLYRLAAMLHAGQVDLQGAPYIGHLERVAAAVPDDCKPVALFHDAIEDGRATRDELAGFLTDDELRAVQLLTRPAGPYDWYIHLIATREGEHGRLARIVKCADLRDNLKRMTPELERSHDHLRRRYERAVSELGCKD